MVHYIRGSVPFICLGEVGDGVGEAAVDVRDVALTTRMSTRRADSSLVEHIL